MKKRKYTKRNKDYWENKSKNVSEASFNPEILSWEPEDTSNISEASFSKRRSRASSSSSTTSSRRNKITLVPMPDEFKNIDELTLPYHTSNRGTKSSISISETVLLCQKAYARIAIFRNTIDVMTEFSNADIYLNGGNKKSRNFIEKWLKRVNISSFTEQFFREYFRSGNVFIYKFLGSFSTNDINALKKTYSEAASKLKIPVRYTIYNPYDIVLHPSSAITNSLYKKILSGYEILKIKQRSTKEDQDVYNSLPPKVKEQINQESWSADGIYVDLEPDRLATVFYKKQDYEPFAIPFGYPVLSDINHKLELKKIDRAISRTIQQVVLLVTMGNEPEKHGINAKAMGAMRRLLENETVGRTIVSDYTTKMEFIIPEIGDILNPDKYKIVNEDIKEGLQNVLFGGGEEKFANQQTKVQVFLERLKEGRKAFVNNFLQPEIKRVCKEMGFKNYPTAKFQDIDLKDETQAKRIYTRLLELGILTPDQAFKAMETGVLPENEELLESQEKYIKERKSGKFTPLVGGGAFQDGESGNKKDSPDPNNSNNGRPEGSNGVPQSTKSVSPIGTSSAKDIFSLKGLEKTLKDFTNLIEASESGLRKENKIKRLNKNQKEYAYNLAENIFKTTIRKNWEEKLSKTIKNPKEELLNIEVNVAEEIDDISDKYEIDGLQAALLYHSKKNNQK